MKIMIRKWKIITLFTVGGTLVPRSWTWGGKIFPYWWQEIINLFQNEAFL